RCVRALTGSPEAARLWRVERYAFAHRVGTALTGGSDGLTPVRGPVVYGVWLDWGLLYIGQTSEAERRLRDLVVGESHHLANTFPAESWHRIVVVEWTKLAESAAPLDDLGPQVAGRALEQRLQTLFRPLANGSRRQPDGGWRNVDWA